MGEDLSKPLLALAEQSGISPWLTDPAILVAVLLACVAIKLFTNRVVVRMLSSLIKGSSIQWDDLLMRHGFFSRVAHFVPALLLHLSGSLYRIDAFATWVQRTALVYCALAGLLVAFAALDTLVDSYQLLRSGRGRPIKGYVQTLKLFVFLVVGILIVATLMDRSPWKLLSGIGAVSAILLLIFKDSILGLVASVQISAYDMVKPGDWVEMPKFGADGDVIDVSLHTVKVQNWDKTITTIPTQALIHDSFKNWRGMSESGGRRIKRSLHIDMGSIRFCDNAMLERLSSIALIRDYMAAKRQELAADNQARGVDAHAAPDARQLTNVGCFRAYVLAYVRNHPKIHDGMTLLVRQLAPGPHGLPLEIYAFTNDTAWENYEAVQSDLFDHLLAAAPEFGLRIFQHPAGTDLQALKA